LWRSDDGGTQWAQITSTQPGDAIQPPCGSANAGLPATIIESLAVSPTDPDLVFAGTTYDRESCNGIYRSTDGGRSWSRVFDEKSTDCPGGPRQGYLDPVTDQPIPEQPVSDIEFAPDDSTKLWAAAGCVVAYSTVGSALAPGFATAPTANSPTDVGMPNTWIRSTTQMPRVTHLAVGSYNGKLIGRHGGRAVWACGTDGQLWSAIYDAAPVSHLPSIGPFIRDSSGAAFLCRNDGVYTKGSGASQLVADDSTNGRPSVYALTNTPGPDQIAFTIRGDPQSIPGVSVPDASGSPGWQECSGCLYGVIRIDRDTSVNSDPETSSFTDTLFSGPPRLPGAFGSGDAAIYGAPLHFSSVGTVLIVSDDENLFAAQAPPSGQQSWHRLTGPDADSYCARTPPGGPFAPFNGDCADPPGVTSIPLHDDFRAFGLTPGTTISIGPPGTLSSPLGECVSGRPTFPNAPTMFVGNDGGIAASPDCGNHWSYGNLPNLPANELTGIAGPAHGSYPALYFGGRDDGSWYSLDGGRSWNSGIDCGDCQGFYSNIHDPYTVVAVDRYFGPNQQGPQGCCRLDFWRDPYGPPSANDSVTWQYQLTPATNWPRMSTDRGWTPVIQPLPSEPDPLAPGHPLYGVISLALVRANTAVLNPDGSHQQLGGWQVERLNAALPAANLITARPAAFNIQQIGDLPPVAGLQYPIVQTSGGVYATTFYAAGKVSSASLNNDDFVNAETDSVYRANAPGPDDHGAYSWTCIVPSDSDANANCAEPTNASTCPADQACHAYKLAVDPYRPTGAQLIYIADTGGMIKESLTSGRTWFTNNMLSGWLTDHGRLNNAPHCQWYCDYGDSDEELHNMLFVPGEPGTAFAAGITGIYMTLDAGCAITRSGCTAEGGGEKWHRLMDSSGTPCQPTSMFFDPDEPDGRALYVACSQRGVLKLLGIPKPSDRYRLDGATKITFHVPTYITPGLGFPRQLTGPLIGDREPGEEPSGPTPIPSPSTSQPTSH
jgi:hypothetical protein